MCSDLIPPHGDPARVIRDQTAVADLRLMTGRPDATHVLRCPSCGGGPREVLTSFVSQGPEDAVVVLTAGDHFPCGACNEHLRLELILNEGDPVWSVVHSDEERSSQDPLPAQAAAQLRWIRQATERFIRGQSLAEIGAEFAAELAAEFAAMPGDDSAPDDHMRRPGYFTPRRVYRLLTTRLAIGLYSVRRVPGEHSTPAQMRYRPSVGVPRFLRNSALRKLHGLSYLDATGVWQPGRGESGLLPRRDGQVICRQCGALMRWEQTQGGGRLRCPSARRTASRCQVTSTRSAATLSAALTSVVADWVLDSSNVADACGLTDRMVEPDSVDSPESGPLAEPATTDAAHPPADPSGIDAWPETAPVVVARSRRLREERRLAQEIRSGWTLRRITAEELNARAALTAERLRLGIVRPDHLAGLIVEMTIEVAPEARPAVAGEGASHQRWVADIEVSQAVLRRLLFPGWPGSDDPLDDPLEEGNRFLSVELHGLNRAEETRQHVIALRRNRLGDLTEQQIADITGITQARVSQILSQAGGEPEPQHLPAVEIRWSNREAQWAQRSPPGPRDAWTKVGDLMRVRELRRKFRRVKRGIPAHLSLRPFTLSQALRLGDTPAIQRAESEAQRRAPQLNEPPNAPRAVRSPSRPLISGPGMAFFAQFSSSHAAAAYLSEMLSEVCLCDEDLERPEAYGGRTVRREAALRYWHGRIAQLPRSPTTQTARELEQAIADLRRGELSAGLDYLGAFYLATRLPAQQHIAGAMLLANFDDSTVARFLTLPVGWIRCYRRVFGADYRPQVAEEPSARQRWTVVAEFLRDVAREGAWRTARVLHYLMQRNHLRMLGPGTVPDGGELRLGEFMAYEIAWESLWCSSVDPEVSEALEELRHELARRSWEQVETEETGPSPAAIQMVVETMQDIVSRAESVSHPSL